ncbi:MAG: glycogen debranching enzyme family protein [Phycisphaerae bacterium]|nr:glycogen debranching enzyme family protein [Phycisphaerae bacterium]
MNIHLPQKICGDVQAALEREWLVTNGIGGFAAGTVAGALTRRYHGLLLAALKPPLGRRLLVTKLDDTAILNDRNYQLYTNLWKSGLERPDGCRFLQRFDLVLNVPTWTYEFGGARLVKRVWMEAGHNATFVRYDLDPNSPPLTLTARLLVNDRPYHHLAPGGERAFQVHAAGAEIEIRSPNGSAPIHVRCAGEAAGGAEWQIDYIWCHDFHLPVEAARGFDHLESHLVVGLCQVRLEPGASVTFIAAAGSDREVDERGALERREQRARTRLEAWAERAGVVAEDAPVPLRQLVLAADQFVVVRPSRDEPDGHTIMAGYPWFTDWGRDTMISLPGLTLVTGRFDVARQILRTWSRYVKDGLIPNRFPDGGDQPEYHTADATLWYLWAIDQYVRATGDVETLAELFPVMNEIIDRHRRGTRHNIQVGEDGLVHAGEEGVNLTWMDAKVGGRVITPRMGKPVELSALWYDALCNMARLADLLERPDAEYMRLAETTRASFERFWNAERGCCFDVLDGPDGADASIRPNQVFTVSLTHSPFPRPRQAAIVAKCARHLLTWCGLRSLAPDEHGYRRRYAGNPVKRDEAYHQGTVWSWLLGPYVIAHYRVHHDAARARRLLEPLYEQLRAHGVGSLSEIFDGDEPHTPNGCVAQAWSVAEALRAWWVTQAQRTPRKIKSGDCL